MNVTVDDRLAMLRPQLNERLTRVGALRCAVHDEPVGAVTINARENGWFDSRWTTCCDAFERRVSSVLGSRTR